AGTILLGQQLPDLNRFFLFRERLQGADPVEARGPWEVGITEPRPSGPPAPSLARLLFDQALQAANAGADPARVWLELGGPAIEAFLNSRDTQGAGAVLAELTSRIGPLNALLKSGIPDGAQANDLARALMNQGNALRKLGRLKAGLAAYDEAIRIYRRLVEEESRGELANDLATALHNLALAREDQGHPQALAAAREAREIRERLVAEGWAHLAGDLEDARKLESRLSSRPS
ncbi:MAG: tetratricopeptide repeat protein, partial [Bryobacterales bacterium]|nr:tetratricopeptide repeat protein [Bryobacterales bacterium]